ncbi:Pyridoxamine 5'-phosphate oxidase [Persephonella hydrogeniphila]|uniref:Pyridoxamine 5'-phosphate oxidase n=1 Tax=Persephonella hydrogeniphila TaxID=198703 RepID=A0A285NS12_9AQUI|nr:pyridoxamine 5'-phosphate oxidase family protein [Persephonella hydrogeniphila]SNZ11747.1 Pyridoxamine 5'-phosphate oxidase [Persephonella hydrogeniphila]
MAERKIPDNVFQEIKELTPSVLATSSDNKPYTTFITWLAAKDKKTVRFALSKDSVSTDNLKKNPYASVEVFGEGFALSISGPVKIIVDEIENLPFPVSVFEMEVEKVVDNLFPGALIAGKIPFEHTGDTVQAQEFDRVVLEELTR